MQPEKRDFSSLWDIIKAAKLIQTFIEEKGKEEFEQDPMCHFAVIAQIQIIGEATKRLSRDFRAIHSSIPWKEIAGMRDILIHLYDCVDLDEVWHVVTKDLPELIAYIEPLLPPEPTEESVS